MQDNKDPILSILEDFIPAGICTHIIADYVYPTDETRKIYNKCMKHLQEEEFIYSFRSSILNEVPLKHVNYNMCGVNLMHNIQHKPRESFSAWFFRKHKLNLLQKPPKLLLTKIYTQRRKCTTLT